MLYAVINTVMRVSQKISDKCHETFILQLITLIFLHKFHYCLYTFAIYAFTCKFLPFGILGAVSDTVKIGFCFFEKSKFGAFKVFFQFWKLIKSEGDESGL